MMWLRTFDAAELHTFPQSWTLQELISHMEQLADTEGCVVCQIRVNDLNLTEADERRLQATPVTQIQTFTAYGDTRLRVAAQALEGFLKALPELEKRTLGLVERLRTEGLRATVMPDFVQVISDLEAVNRLFHRLEIPIGSLQQLVNSIVQAFETGDAVLVADLLEYELTQHFQSWQDKIQSEFKTTNPSLDRPQDPPLVDGVP
jgi:hypothetical protein